MKKLIILSWLILCALLLVGCNAVAPSTEPTETTESNATESQKPKPTTPPDETESSATSPPYIYDYPELDTDAYDDIILLGSVSGSVGPERLEYEDENVEPTISMEFFDGTFDVVYSSSVRKSGSTFHLYRNEEDFMRNCSFWEDGSLRSILMHYYDHVTFDTEEPYIQLTKELFSKYGVTIGEEYVLSCVTGYIVESEEYKYETRNRVNKFYIPENENEKIEEYTFTFRKYVSGHPTTDYYEINYDFGINTLMMFFSENRFENVETVVINREIAQRIAFEHIQFAAHVPNPLIEFKNAVLALIDGRPCYLFTYGIYGDGGIMLGITGVCGIYVKQYTLKE